MIINNNKKSLRNSILTKRNKLPNIKNMHYEYVYKEKFNDFFQEYIKRKQPKIIGGYYPIKNEINILPILDMCREKGFITALPLCHKDKQAMTYHKFDGDMDSLEPDIYGILAPNYHLPIVPDLIICPAVAVSSVTNQRLGYGGGYFDRYAALNSSVDFVAGFCDFQYVNNSEYFEVHDLTFYHSFNLDK